MCILTCEGDILTNRCIFPCETIQNPSPTPCRLGGHSVGWNFKEHDIFSRKHIRRTMKRLTGPASMHTCVGRSTENPKENKLTEKEQGMGSCDTFAMAAHFPPTLPTTSFQAGEHPTICVVSHADFLLSLLSPVWHPNSRYSPTFSWYSRPQTGIQLHLNFSPQNYLVYISYMNHHQAWIKRYRHKSQWSLFMK